MDFTIIEEPTEAKFLWSKISTEKRKESLGIILREEGILPENLPRLVDDYNAVYIQAKKNRSNILFEESNPLQIKKINKEKMINDSIQTLLKKNYFAPIVLNKKNFYNSNIVPNYYNSLFNHVFTNKEDLVSLEKIPNPYDHLVLKEEKFKDIVGTEENPLVDVLPNNRKIIRFADLKRVNSKIPALEQINDSLKPKKIIQHYNNTDYFDNSVVTSKNSINMVGFYLNSCLNYSDSFVNYTMTPYLSKVYKINYLENLDLPIPTPPEWIGSSRDLQESRKQTENVNIIDKTVLDTSDKKVQSNEIDDIFQQNLGKCDGLSMVYFNNLSDQPTRKKQVNAWINIIDKLLHLLQNKKTNVTSDYFLYIFNKELRNLSITNNALSEKALKDLYLGLEKVSGNLINYLYHTQSYTYWYVIASIIKKIVGLELLASNRKEINNKIKMLKSIEKTPLRLYQKICKNIDKSKYENYLLICKNGVSTTRRDVLQYRYDTLTKLIHQYNKYTKNNKQLTKIKNFLMKIYVDNQNQFMKRDLYEWYIKIVFGEKVFIETINRAIYSKHTLYNVLSSVQKDKITKFISALDRNRNKIQKLLESDDPAIKLRITYDTSSDEAKRYNALSQLYNKYIDKKADKNRQYNLIDTNYEIMCEHEKILLEIYKTYNEDKLKKLRDTLSKEFYSTTEDNDTEFYILCKYCARPIYRTAIKMYDIYQKDTGYKNMGYGKETMSTIDTKIMRQIKMWLDIINFIIKDRISYSITPESIFSSISDEVKRYFTKYKVRKISQLADVEEIRIEPRIDKIIAYYALAKVIHEIVRSQGNIYPVGSRDIVEKYAQEGKNKELENYLFEWAFKQIKKLDLPIFTKNDFTEKNRFISVLKQIYEKLKKSDIHIKANFILTPMSCLVKDKINNEINKILALFKKLSNNEIIRSGINRRGFIPAKVYKELINRYNMAILRKIYKYHITCKLAQYNKNIDKEPINQTPNEWININKLSVHLDSDITEIKKYNYNMFLNYYKYNMNTWWVNYYHNIELMNNVQQAFRYDIDTYLCIKKKFFQQNRKRHLKDRLKGKYVDMYQNVYDAFHKMKMDFSYEVITYFQNLCIDNTPHSFYGYICTNCGQTLSDLETPSKDYLQLMKKAYLDIQKEKEKYVLDLKDVSKLVLPTINKHGKLYKLYTNYDFNKKINQIVKFLVTYKNIDPNVLVTYQMKKFNRENNGKYLTDVIKNFGILKRRENAEKIKKNINYSKFKRTFQRYRVIQLDKYIKLILQFYSILKYNRHIELLKKYSNAKFLIKYIKQNIRLSYDFDIDFDFINNLYDAQDLNFNIKINIIFSIFIDIIHTILFKNIKDIRKDSNVTLLSNFIVEMLDILLYSQRHNDTTKRDFSMSDMIAGLKMYRKQQAFLEKSMQEKIESGLLSLSYEEQEEAFQNLYFDLGLSGLQYVPADTPSTDTTYAPRSRMYTGPVKFNYRRFDCDYCDEEADPLGVDERNVSIQN